MLSQLIQPDRSNNQSLSPAINNIRPSHSGLEDKLFLKRVSMIKNHQLDGSVATAAKQSNVTQQWQILGENRFKPTAGLWP